MTTDHERDDPRRKAFRHAGVSYHLTTGRLRNTVHVFTGADDQVGAVTQLALPHAVWEWLRDVYTPPSLKPMTEPVYGTVLPGHVFIIREVATTFERRFDNLEQLIGYVESWPKVPPAKINWPEHAFLPGDQGFLKDGGTLDLGVPTHLSLRERIERTIAHLDQPNMLTFMSRGDAIALLSNLLNDEMWSKDG